MNTFEQISRLDDETIARNLPRAVNGERECTATGLAYIAQYDARQMFLSAGYPSIHAYCVGHLKFSIDAAKKRVQAARAIREFPALFDAVADGRLHLSAVVILAPKLTTDNVGELVAAAAYRSKLEIEQILASLCPLLATPCAVGAPGHRESTERPASDTTPRAPGHHESIEQASMVLPATDTTPRAAGHASSPIGIDQPTPTQVVPPPEPRPFRLPAIGKSASEKLCRLRDLLSHRIPSGSIVELLEYALDAGIERAEKQKYAKTSKPRTSRPRPTQGKRHIPADVRRAVRDRDGDRCAFVSADGHRCEARGALEFDHIQPFARGGEATADNLRLLCRPHNRYAAEEFYGATFMNGKRWRATGTGRSEIRTSEAQGSVAGV